MWIRWSPTTPSQNGVGMTMPIPQGEREATALVRPGSRMAAAKNCGKLLGKNSPLSSAGWKPPSAVLHTTIIGMTQSAPQFYWKAKRIYWFMVWGNCRTKEIVHRLANGESIKELTDIRGTCLFDRTSQHPAGGKRMSQL